MISWLLIMLAMLFTFLFSFFLFSTYFSFLTATFFFLFETQYFTYYTLRFMTKIAIAPSLSLSPFCNPIQSISIHSIHTPLFSFFLSTTAGISFFFSFFICFLHDTIAYCIQINHNKFNDTSAARLTTLTRRWKCPFKFEIYLKRSVLHSFFLFAFKIP